jgi:hypothetical protein
VRSNPTTTKEDRKTMPGDMPGHVGKGTIVHKLDAAVNDTALGGRREQLLKRLRARNPDGSWMETLTVIGQSVLSLIPKEVRHLSDHWFNTGSGWWLPHQPIEILVRHGLIQGIELANKPDAAGKPRRMDCYWVCGLPHVNVTSCVSPTQVTWLLMTPGPPTSDRIPEDYAGITQREEIYTARHRGRGPGEYQVKLDEDYVEFVQPLAH